MPSKRPICLSVDGLGSGHNGHKPKGPKCERPQTGKATNRNGHKPEWPQTGRPQTETATNRNGHKPEWPQIGIDTTVPTQPSNSVGFDIV